MANDYAKALGAKLRQVRNQQGLSLQGVEAKSGGVWKAVVVGCPKLDDNQFYTNKLTELFSKSDVKSITVLKMEVPCCGGIAIAAQQALAACGKQIPFKVVTIGIQGDIKG